MKNSRSDIQGHTKKVSIHYNSILSKVALEIRIPSCRSHLLHTKTVSIHYYSFLSKVALEMGIPSVGVIFSSQKQEVFTTTVFLVK